MRPFVRETPPDCAANGLCLLPRPVPVNTTRTHLVKNILQDIQNGKRLPIARPMVCACFPVPVNTTRTHLVKNILQDIQNGKRLPLAAPMGPSLRGREVSLF
ncbi:MAG: hypothetical protein PHR97_08750 [Bacteroidales bacterium]|nr:hypothetical protein [Bacteroidales bacterium]